MLSADVVEFAASSCRPSRAHGVADVVRHGGGILPAWVIASVASRNFRCLRTLDRLIQCGAGMSASRVSGTSVSDRPRLSPALQVRGAAADFGSQTTSGGDTEQEQPDSASRS